VLLASVGVGIVIVSREQQLENILIFEGTPQVVDPPIYDDQERAKVPHLPGLRGRQGSYEWETFYQLAQKEFNRSFHLRQLTATLLRGLYGRLLIAVLKTMISSRACKIWPVGILRQRLDDLLLQDRRELASPDSCHQVADFVGDGKVVRHLDPSGSWLGIMNIYGFSRATDSIDGCDYSEREFMTMNIDADGVPTVTVTILRQGSWTRIYLK